MSMFRKKGDEYFQFEGSGMVGKSSYTKRSLLKGEGEQAHKYYAQKIYQHQRART